MSYINHLISKIEQLPEISKWLSTKGETRPLYANNRELLALASRVCCTVNRWQLETANALAHAHGHGWAVPSQDFSSAFGDKNEYELIEVLEKTATYVDTNGIILPDIDGSGNVTHRTGTGRLEWIISSDEITLKIHRPAGEAFTAIAREYHSRGWVLDVFIGEVQFHHYHVEIIREALKALISAGLLPDHLNNDEVFEPILQHAIPAPISSYAE